MRAPVWTPSLLRADAVARLLAYRTIAEDHVESSRANPVPDADLPVLIVHTPIETRELRAEAGTAPEFTATIMLHIEARVLATATATAEAMLDRLVAEVLDCLLSDADFIRRWEKISSVNVRTNFPNDASKSVGEADILIECVYVDRYEPRATAAFAGADFNPGDAPAAPPGAIAPPIRADAA